MSSEQTPGQPADLAALRSAALATQKQAEDAAAALLAADPTSGPPPPAPGGPPPSAATGIDLVALETLMSRAIAKSAEGLRDGILAVTRENTVIKAPQARLESQRPRVNDVGKSEGKTVSLAKQLDFTEDLLASPWVSYSTSLLVLVCLLVPLPPRKLSAVCSSPIVRTVCSCTSSWRSSSRPRNQS